MTRKARWGRRVEAAKNEAEWESPSRGGMEVGEDHLGAKHGDRESMLVDTAA
jgi:hypothetical protein